MRNRYASCVPARFAAGLRCPASQQATCTLVKRVANQQSQALNEQTSVKKRVRQHCSQVSWEVGA